MAGFYANHLKSARARYLAGEIEKELSAPPARKDPSIIFQFKTKDKSDLSQVLAAGHAIIRDHPELFYFGPDLEAHFDGGRVTLKGRLLYSPEQIQVLKAKINEKAAAIFKLVPPNAQAWEKERIIFEYLQLNTVYTDDEAPERYNIVGSLIEGKAVCEGISKAFAVLCRNLGIACIVVFSDTHMWNMVRIDGVLANVDATFGTSEPRQFCDYSYFNVSDREMINSKHLKELDCVPSCLNSSADYFSKNNLYFSDEQQLRAHITKCLFLHKFPIYAKLASGNVVRAIKSATLLSPYNLTYSYNEKTNTILITTQ